MPVELRVRAEAEGVSLSDKHNMITWRPISDERGKEQLWSVPDNPPRGILFYQIIKYAKPLTGVSESPIAAKNHTARTSTDDTGDPLKAWNF